ncbi:calcium-binding protein [Microvirga lupini]|nr:calcium-binding protein [Microvirga lupini]
MKSTEVEYVIPEYTNVRYFSSLEELLLAERDAEAVFHTASVLGNSLSNRIIGNSLDNNLFGGSGQDTLEGREGDDFLSGDLGADLLIGGNGNDYYIVDDLGDVIIEDGSGTADWVASAFSYVLPDTIEKLNLSAGRPLAETYLNINGTGNASDNYIAGNAGNNHLRGLGGDDMLMDVGGTDTLEGGMGDDTYHIESANSIIVEDTSGGYDTAFLMYNVPNLSSFDFTKVKNIEVLHFVNYADGQYIAAETPEFFLLDDKLNPKNAADLDAFEVKDTIGLSKSIFSKIAKKGELKKGAFWTGSKAHDKDDRIIYDKKAGDLYYDADGSGSRKAVKFADVDKKLKMTASDFLVF